MKNDNVLTQAPKVEGSWDLHQLCDTRSSSDFHHFGRDCREKKLLLSRVVVVASGAGADKTYLPALVSLIGYPMIEYLHSHAV